MSKEITIGTLTIKRFNGDEVWNITEGEFSISPRHDYFVLNIWVRSNRSLISMPSSEDNEEENLDRISPRIELQTKLTYADYQNLIGKSFKFIIDETPNEEDDEFSNFYYYGHEETYANVIEILEKKGLMYHVRSISAASDVTVYDGSKPDNEIEIDCWLEMKQEKTGYWTVT